MEFDEAPTVYTANLRPITHIGIKEIKLKKEYTSHRIIRLYGKHDNGERKLLSRIRIKYKNLKRPVIMPIKNNVAYRYYEIWKTDKTRI